MVNKGAWTIFSEKPRTEIDSVTQNEAMVK